MSFKKLAIATAMGVSVLSSGVAFAENGRIDFKGTITTNPCSISGEDMEKEVNLGVVTVTDLTNGGTNDGTSIPRKFNIALENCEVSTGNDEITVNMTGNSSEYTDMFGLNGNQLGAGLVIEKDGVKIKPGVSTAAQTLTNGRNTLEFTAYVQGGGSTATIEAGDFTATTNFTLAYQ